MTELIPVISDIQAPLHDERAVAAIATFLADRDLDSVCVGDTLDGWQVSRWCRGLRGEFDGKLAEGRDTTVRILKDLRVKHLSRSNHDDRIETYVSKYAPALSSLPELTVEAFLKLEEIGCEFHRTPYELAPGWILLHGDEGPLIKAPGGTACGLATRFGKSVVGGHTHKLGLVHSHRGFAGKISEEVWGFEVGHVMDMTQAEYLPGGFGNWQQGFGVLVVEGDEVTPVPVFIRDGSFYFDGKRWSA